MNAAMEETVKGMDSIVVNGVNIVLGIDYKTLQPRLWVTDTIFDSVANSLQSKSTDKKD